jgi:tRNA C32,U32 (ribose-2'-O)-methylase TrmJ
MAYELYLAREQPASRVQLEQPLASGAELELFYRHLEEVMAEIRFEDRTGYLMQRLRRLFNRAQIDANELNILRGILSAVQEGRNQGRRRPPGTQRGSE